MPRQFVAIVAGTCLPAVLLFLLWAIQGMRRFGALGLWLCGGGLFFVQMKKGFVMLHPPAAEGRRVEAAAHGKDSVSLGADSDADDPFTPYRLRV